MSYQMGPLEGARLTRIGDDIWAADRELILATGLRVPIRMVVLRDRRRQLLCYSPIDMDSQTLEALEGLGTVTWLVIPNRLHETFVSQARETFTTARVLAGPDVATPGVEMLPLEGAIGDLADFRVVHSARGFTELVLYHDASETLVLSDLIVNVSAADLPLKLWLLLNGAWGRPGHLHTQRWWYLKNRRALGEFYRWSMARPFRQISVSHGSIIRDGARETVYRLFRRYAGPETALVR